MKKQIFAAEARPPLQAPKFALLGFCAELCLLMLTIGLGASGLRAQQTQSTSITVSPVNPSVSVGQTQQFTALSGNLLDLQGARLITAGGVHTCALLSDGTVECWGLNEYGELGNGTTSNSSSPVAVNGVEGATAITAGNIHTCVLLSNGTVQCWGYNSDGEIGDGTFTFDSTTPIQVTGLNGVTAIAAGYTHTCALLSDGTAKCWGDNTYGELGNGTTADSNIPVAVTGLSNATAIVAGADFTCALLSDGTAKCWGLNEFDELGNGTSTNSSTAVAVTGLNGAMAIAAGADHTCALLSAGTARCWGNNIDGELGNGTTTNSNTPVTVTGLNGITAVAAGGFHTCALLSNQTMDCWGQNGDGELGNGITIQSTTPVSVAGLSGAVAIAVGHDHTCAQLTDGTLECWGDNESGQLGNGTTANSSTPVAVTGNSLPGLGSISVSVGYSHTCALLSGGTAECWGYDLSGELGNGTTNNSDTPVAVTGLNGGIEIGAGGYHTCALLSGGASCWGYNANGQLGNGTTTDSSTPIVVSGLNAVTTIGGGLYHTCALLSDGAVSCWGYNAYGQLGNGTANQSTTPVAVTGLGGVKSIAVGGLHTCALISNGTVECWGDNAYGELGNGTTMQSTTPIVVAGLSGVTAITAGGYHTCALLLSGTVECWGLNEFGELGNGTTNNSAAPVAVTGLSGVTAISGGLDHTCALLTGGTVNCWGDNGVGLLGNGSATPNFSTLPLATELSGATAIAAGGDHTCALLSSGAVSCWGDNASGQLGNGTTNNSSAPLATNSLVTSVAWTSGNTGVATIDPAGGLANAVAAGNTMVPATYGTLGANTTLTVNSSSAPAPAVTLSTLLLTYSSQTVNTTSAAQPVTLTNTGNASLSISAISISGDFGETNNCPTSLTPNTGCTINVTFTPSGTGTRSGTLTIKDNSVENPQSVSLTGSGVPPTSTGFSIPANQPWTDTGTAITAGQQVRVNAFGEIYVGAESNPALDNQTPNGQPWPACATGTVVTFTAPGLSCWSLIGEIGQGGPAFEVGSSITFTATASGEFYLGVNDNVFGDNQGSWGVTINVSEGSNGPNSPENITVLANPMSVSESSPTGSTITAAVSDANGNALPGVTVSFSTSLGLLSALSAQTDASGQASVTLTPNSDSQVPLIATVSASAGTAENIAHVTFVPPATNTTNWQASSAFNVAQVTLNLSQFLAPPIDAYNACIDVFVCKGTSVNASQLPSADAYLITPTGSAAQFSAALSQFFGINQCSNSSGANCIQNTYNPVAVVILELPAIQTSNILFNSNLQTPLTLNLPSSLSSLFGNASIGSTPSGYVDLAFTISRYSTSTSQQLLSTFIQALAGDVAAFVKSSTSQTISALEGDLQALLSVGDVTVSVITSDLSQTGSLNSYMLLDLYGLPAYLQGFIQGEFQVNGYLGKVFSIVQAATDLIAAAPTGVATALPISRLVLTSFDLAVELLPQLADPTLQNNELFQWFETGLNSITTLVDPPGVTIVPSFYDATNSLVLGYNPLNGSMTYAGQDGILFLVGDGYLALLGENSNSPANYSETLTALGTNTPMPYSVQDRSYNRNEQVQEYDGMLIGGSSAMTPIEFNVSTGALTPQTYLAPAITVQQSGGTGTITASAVLSDGSASTATQAFLILNGQESAMTEENASTFQIAVNNTSTTPTSFMVYMITPNTPGGFSSGILPAVIPAVSLPALPLNFSGQIVGTTSISQSVMLGNSGNASLTVDGISIIGTNSGDFTIASGGTCPAPGGTLGAGSTCMVNVTFTPTATGTRSATLTFSDNAAGSPQSFSISGIATDFSFGPGSGGSTSATITAGQTATYDLQANSLNGFTGQITITCSGAPSLATCSPSTGTVNVNGSAVPFSIMVTTTANSALPPTMPLHSPLLTTDLLRTLEYLALVLGLYLVITFSRRRKWRSAALALVAIALVLTLTSCSSGGGNSGSSGTAPAAGTPPNTYTLTVSGMSGGASRPLSLSLTVK
jgi:alpha-tubulin suppressor-like RCC1 family protein